MRKLLLLSALLLGSMAAKAQEIIYVCQGNSFSAYPISSLGDITFSGSTVIIGSTSATTASYTYNMADIDSITFAEPVFPQEEEDYIHITFDESTASVTIPSNITDVTYTVKGAHVSITSNTTSEEYNYVVDGATTEGSLTINGSYKLTLTLAGLDLSSSTVAPLRVLCGKRIAVVLKEGTTNTISDKVNEELKATMYFKGHPEFEGGGTLNVTSQCGHAIYAKEYLQLKKSTGTINILGATKDGIHCGSGDKDDPDNYFLMNGGTVNISGCVTDCIDADDYGNVIIKGGTLNLTVPYDGVGLKVDSILTMEDGAINMTVAEDLATGIRVAYKGYFNGGTISGTVSGMGTKGINAKKYTSATKTVLNGGDLYFNGTDVDLTVSGNAYSADATKCMGIRAEGDFTQTAGTIKLRVTSSDAIGLKTGGKETLSGGTLDVTSSSSAHAVSAVNFNMQEGTFTVKCTGADSKNLDVDELMTISGGTVTMNNSGSDAKVMKAWFAKLTGGNITLTATGDGGKGIKVDTVLVIGDQTKGAGPILSVSTTGAATGSTTNQGGGNNPWGGGGGGRGPGGGGGGGIQPGGQESSSGGSPKAIKCGASDQNKVGTIYFYGGTTTVSTKKDKGEGIEGKAAIYFHGGDVIANCYDDCVNSGGKIEWDGSRVYCYSNGNDAVDSNYGRTGAVTVNSGVLIAITSKGSPEEGIDCDNDRYIVINGGYVFSAGGQQSSGSYSNTGTQNAYKVSKKSVSANQYYSLCNSAGKALMTLKMPVSINENYSIISAPSLSSVKSGSNAPTGYSESFNNCVFIGGTTSNNNSWY